MVGDFGTISAFKRSISTTVNDANLIIVDLVLPDGDGLTTALEAMDILPNKVGLIVISGRPTPDLFERLSENVSGGWAFLQKNSKGNLRQAINAVQSGLVMVDPGLKKLFARDGKSVALSDQERSAMDKVAEGKSNAVISQEIFASEKTVERLRHGDLKGRPTPRRNQPECQRHVNTPRGCPGRRIVRSKKPRFAFQTFTETPPAPHQRWGLELRTSLTKAGDGAKCGAKFAATSHVIYIEVTEVRSEWKECAQNLSFVFVASDLPAKTHVGR